MGCASMLVWVVVLGLLLVVCVGKEVHWGVWCDCAPPWVRVFHVPSPWCDRGLTCVWDMGSVGLERLVDARSLLVVRGCAL